MNILVIFRSLRKDGNTDLMVYGLENGTSLHHLMDVVPVDDNKIAPYNCCNTP